MGRIDEGITVRQAALVSLEAVGGKVEGRTALQKIMYFVSVALRRDFGHRAHYYGPYSRPLENALTSSALAEEVTETIERYPTYLSGPDIRKYTYELTQSGTKAADAARAEYQDEANTILATVESVRAVVPDLEQQTLSMAAKIHFIVIHQDDPPDISEIPELAKQLGWRISDGQVRQSIDLLQRLKLLRVESNRV
jgi:uncharacterized protein YwgA